MVGGGKNDPLFDTNTVLVSPILPHDDEFDRYFADWRVSERPTFSNTGTGPNEVAWLLDIEGFHGVATSTSGDRSGPFIPPDGIFPKGNQPAPVGSVPVPASIWALATAFGLLGVMRTLKRKS